MNVFGQQVGVVEQLLPDIDRVAALAKFNGQGLHKKGDGGIFSLIILKVF